MKLRAAVVGTGFIGPVHVEGLKRADQRVLSSDIGDCMCERQGASRRYRAPRLSNRTNVPSQPRLRDSY